MVGAMDYEHLLRIIYQVGRHGKKGVNADVYRKLERAERIYLLELENIEKGQPRLRTTSIDDLKHEYSVQCTKLWYIVSGAISIAIKDYSNIFNEDEVLSLNHLTKEPEKITKIEVDKAIEVAQKIFIQYKIYPS